MFASPDDAYLGGLPNKHIKIVRKDYDILRKEKRSPYAIKAYIDKYMLSVLLSEESFKVVDEIIDQKAKGLIREIPSFLHRALDSVRLHLFPDGPESVRRVSSVNKISLRGLDLLQHTPIVNQAQYGLKFWPDEAFFADYSPVELTADEKRSVRNDVVALYGDGYQEDDIKIFVNFYLESKSGDPYFKNPRYKMKAFDKVRKRDKKQKQNHQNKTDCTGTSTRKLILGSSGLPKFVPVSPSGSDSSVLLPVSPSGSGSSSGQTSPRSGTSECSCPEMDAWLPRDWRPDEHYLEGLSVSQKQILLENLPELYEAGYPSVGVKSVVDQYLLEVLLPPDEHDKFFDKVEHNPNFETNLITKRNKYNK